MSLSTSDKARIAIIDDDASVRRSLVRTFSVAGLEVVAFASAAEFLDASDAAGVSCVVSDLRMPEVDGLQLQRMLQAKLPHLSMVFITGHGDVATSVAAMKSGAVDFLEKPLNRIALLEAIDRAIDRSRKLLADSEDLAGLKIRETRLTGRQRQVFALVAAGLLNKQIAAELGTTEKTIKQHRGRVMEKMEAESFAALVIMAEKLGIRPVDGDFSKARGKLTF